MSQAASSPVMPWREIPRQTWLASLGSVCATWMVIMAARWFALQAADVNGALGVGADAGSWLSTVYAVCEPIGVVLGSWLGVALSPRRVLPPAITVFLLGMALPLPAPSYDLLMASRIVTGLAAGLITPQCIVIQLQTWSPARTPVAIAFFLSGPTLAPQLGGVLGAWGVTQFGWTFVLWASAPLGLLALAAAQLGGRREAYRWRPLVHTDLPGLVSLSAALGFFVCAVSQGDRLRWFQSPTIAILFLAAAACLGIFMARDWERIRHPALWIGLLRRWNVALSVAALPALLLGVSLSVSIVPSILAQVRGFRPEQIAPALWAVAWPQFLAYPACLLLLQRKLIEPRLMAVLGLATVAAGALVDLRLTSQWEVGDLYPGQVIQGFGLPLLGMPLIYLFTGDLRPPAEAFPAAGLLNLTRVLSGTIATAWTTSALRLGAQAKYDDLLANTAFYPFARDETVSRLAQRFARTTPDPAIAHSQAIQVLTNGARREAAVLGATSTLATLAGLLLAAALLLVLMDEYGSGKALRPWETRR